MVYFYTAPSQIESYLQLILHFDTFWLAAGWRHRPVTFQLLLPSQGLAIQLQHILRLKTSKMLWVASVWLPICWYELGGLFDVFLLQRVVLILCWKQQEDKSYWGIPSDISRFANTKSSVCPHSNIGRRRNKTTNKQILADGWYFREFRREAKTDLNHGAPPSLPLNTLLHSQLSKLEWGKWVRAGWWWIKWSNYSVFSEFENNVFIFQDQWTSNLFLTGMSKPHINKYYTVYEKV